MSAAAGGLIVDGFTKHDIECDGNSVYVCGSFKNEWAAKTFVSIFYKYFSTSYRKCGVPVASDFCDANPGAVISLTSHSWESKYDHTWSYSKGWKVRRWSLEGLDSGFSIWKRSNSCVKSLHSQLVGHVL